MRLPDQEPHSIENSAPSSARRARGNFTWDSGALLLAGWGAMDRNRSQTLASHLKTFGFRVSTRCQEGRGYGWLRENQEPLRARRVLSCVGLS